MIRLTQGEKPGKVLVYEEEDGRVSCELGEVARRCAHVSLTEKLVHLRWS